MTDERTAADPDGLSFFTENAPHDKPAASVFGGPATGRLDALFAEGGADESASTWVPEDVIKLPTAPIVTTSTLGHMVEPIAQPAPYTGVERRANRRADDQVQERAPQALVPVVDEVTEQLAAEITAIAPIDPDATRDFILNGPRIDHGRGIKKRSLRMSLGRSAS